MAITLGNIIFLIFLFLMGAVLAVFTGAGSSIKNGVICGAVTIILCLVMMFILSWYNTSTAQGIRNYKDFKSNMSNGIEREIIITAEDGREIFKYSGKVDIESNHTDNYIKFESEEGKRYIIYYGIQDTILIREV